MEEHHLIAVLREDLEDLVRCQEEDGAGADVVTGEGLHHGEAALPGHLPAGQVLAGALGDQHDGGRVPDTQLVVVSRPGDREPGNIVTITTTITTFIIMLLIQYHHIASRGEKQAHKHKIDVSD